MTSCWYSELLLLFLIWLLLALVVRGLLLLFEKAPPWLGKPLQEDEAAEQGLEPGGIVWSGWRLLWVPVVLALFLIHRFYVPLALLWMVGYCLLKASGC